jgi:hypothetical protein
MTMDWKVLKCGNCEELKLGVHATALGLAAVCGLYNTFAWLSRRQQHLAVNAILYAALIAWEQQHVSHHMAEIRRPRADPARAPVEPEPIATPQPIAA